ncbi:Glycosyl hydrolase family 10 protein [Abeliophyllum distichum]|uniref:Glycosyl hydrolase family 10 protein n=1 Tax=Abeliophyllum distichum TaxID=126358 RepID=A0ABD1QWJ0_9LAMI
MCLAKPEEAHYGGGIVVNPELNQRLKGWTTLGNAKVEIQESEDGNRYIVASNRNGTLDGFTQKFNLEKDKLYMFSAWLRVSQGKAHIAAMFKTQYGNKIAGWAMSQKGCWSMLKGGIVVNSSGPAHLYFETKDTSVDIDIMADSISLQPFTHEEWKSHQDQNIEKIRKSKVKFQAIDQHGQPLANAIISIKQNKPGFPFGCAINQNILSNIAYQNWFVSRFKYTVFENEMKWISTESSRGIENYNLADALLKFAKTHNIQTRGHNIFWDDPKYQPYWLGGLSTNDLWNATNQRINSIMKRYQRQLIHWDVVNENLHFSYFESKLGNKASSIFYEKANKIDWKTTPFLNEYNTIEESRDGAATPAKYLQKIKQMRQDGYKGPLGIGLESHFQYANLPYIRASLDQLASAKLPIWITELDVKPGPNQAAYLEQVIREVHAHAGVNGIIMWSAWSPQGCYTMCLTDNNFKNLATGDVVDKFLSELRVVAGLNGTTDSNGYFATSLFHGEYEAKISHPSALPESYNLTRFNVASIDEARERTMHVKINA